MLSFTYRFCQDHQSGVGGGVVLYIAEDLAAMPCDVLVLITLCGR